MLCAVDYIFNLLCAFNSLRPMKKFVFSVVSRATGSLQIKPRGFGDENGGTSTDHIDACAYKMPFCCSIQKSKNIRYRDVKNSTRSNLKKGLLGHSIRI